jgi:hypothetical protein
MQKNKQKLQPLWKISGMEELDQVNTLRSEFMKELGESQLSRKTKDEALAAIELWMRDFYAVAKIALDDKVMLMKALKG